MTKAFNPLIVCQVVIMVLNGIKEAHNGVAVHVGGEGIHIHDGGNSKKLEILVDILERRGTEAAYVPWKHHVLDEQKA